MSQQHSKSEDDIGAFGLTSEPTPGPSDLSQILLKTNSMSETLDNMEKVRRKLMSKLADTTLDPISQVFKGHDDALFQTFSDNNDSGDNNDKFEFYTEKAVLTKPTKSKKLPYTGGELNLQWYPNHGHDNEEGRNTSYYLNVLQTACESEADVFMLLENAESMSDSIGCVRTENVWKTLNPLLRQLSVVNLNNCACDISYYLYHNPDQLAPYLKCLSRVKHLLSNPSNAMEILEDRITLAADILQTKIQESTAREDETLKFAKHVSNVSTSLANTLEQFESIVVRAKRLDIIPAPESKPITEISVPSIPSQKPGFRVVKISLSESGEYEGRYSIKVDSNKIVSINPPDNIPELIGLTGYAPRNQEIFINLDQNIIINKICANPKYRLAFKPSIDPSFARVEIFRELSKGVKSATNQWIKY